MRRLLSTTAIALVLAIPAQARAQLVIGPGIAWHDDFDLGVGVWGVTPLPSLHENMSIGGDLGFFFPDCGGASGIDCSYFEINANLIYSFAGEDMPVTPFVLGGLNIARFSVDTNVDLPLGFSYGASSTDVGLNVGGGISFGSGDGGIQPVAGAKLELGGGEGLIIFGGIGFPL